ncbi:hypothetical protein J437_LFUL011607 [Ladona fulva]|uniref:Uncharacterized protein n=1 Tax=Ladona fulva TaxID=123851 RepID=A0A8K0KAZ5_LADFU|nr:hypothetical protein J437_LFUL011607 [Ladona fulva]
MRLRWRSSETRIHSLKDVIGNLLKVIDIVLSNHSHDATFSAFRVHVGKPIGNKPNARSTLAILDKLELESGEGARSEEEEARRFGFEEAYHEGRLTRWQRLKPRIWALFDEPHSSHAAKCATGDEILNCM